jgi:CRP-like cAMP-binding protein
MSLLDLAAGLPLVTYPAGEVLIEQGDSEVRLLVLVHGAVTVERDGVTVARITEPGSVFGEMSLALRRPATATVRCESDAQLRVADEPTTFLADNPGAALELLRISAARVDALTSYLVDVKRQYADEPGHLGMLDTVLGALVQQQPGRARPGSVRDPDG